MVARILTVAFEGISTRCIDVQAQLLNGLPAFHIVGLPDKAVAESRERIRSAFHSMGLSLPPKRIIINLAPADVQKEGSHYDLPMALALLVSLDVIDAEEVSNYIALGELNLDGSIAKVSGVLPAAIEAIAQERGIICPKVCGSEARWAGDLSILASSHLIDIVNHLKGKSYLPPVEEVDFSTLKNCISDFRDVKGHRLAKRAMEIAAVGRHHLLMVGPPGSGKSMLACRLPSILPPLTPRESLELSMIHSVAGIAPKEGLVMERPYRDPHHSASLPAMVGGGAKGKPGEISLAHQGVLFLDELPEFSRAVLESLRQPLEMGYVSVARVNAHLTYPADVQLIAAMNPCRCGHMGDVKKQCHRVPLCGQDYAKKLSGPLLDRFDMVVSVPSVKVQELRSMEDTDSSKDISNRVQMALQFQENVRKQTVFNARIDSKDLLKTRHVDPVTKDYLDQVAEKMSLTTRGYFRVLRVARSIADLAASEVIQKNHLLEALNYRHVL